MRMDRCALVLTALTLACSKSASPSPTGGAPSSGSVATSSSGSPVASAEVAALAGVPAHPFEVKSGIVKRTNGVTQGEQTLYFDDFGARSATVSVTNMKILGQTIHSEHVSLDADGYHVDYDVEKKTGTRRKSPPGASAPAGGGAPGVDVKNLTAEMKKRMKLEELPAKTIDGRVASGYAIETMGMKVKTWTWKGILMHRETESGEVLGIVLGKLPVVISVKSLQTDIPIPPETFVVPADVKIKDFGM